MTTQIASFEEWWLILQKLALAENFPLDFEEPDAYREYYEDGDSPSDALEIEQEYYDHGTTSEETH